MQIPVAGLVWHMDRSIGRFAPPVSPETVIGPLAPTFTVATANAPIPFSPGISTMPGSLLAASATMSGVGVVDADKSKVLRPDSVWADPVLKQLKLNATSVGGNGLVGVIEIDRKSTRLNSSH